MQINPQVQAYLDMLASAGEPPQHALSVEDIRAGFLGWLAWPANQRSLAAL